MKISKKAYEIVDNYRRKSTKKLEGLERNQYEVIKRVYHYRDSKFFEYPDQDAIFWNVVTPYLPHFAKLIDLDPKDFRPKGQGDTNFFQAWILRRKLQSWVRENNFDVDIDDLTKLIASFGSYVVKVVERDGKEPKLDLCDLRNIALESEAETIRESDVVELHYKTKHEIKKKDVWENNEKAIENALEKNDKKEIWEFTGEIEEEGEFKYKHVIGAGKGDKEVILFEEDIKKEDSPYYDFHLTEFNGMWLRKGIFEKCFDYQERANTVVNENAEATSIASLLLMRTSDPKTSGNVLHQAISGQIINSNDLQQVGIDNRAFTTLLNELEIIENQVRRELMLPDIATGEPLKSGTPFRSAALMSSAQKSAFKQMRTRIASGLVDVLEERIMPELIKDWNRGDVVEIAEDVQDIEMYDEAVRTVTRAKVYQKANERGVEVTQEIEEQIEEMVDKKIQRNGRKIKTPKKFFNFEYGLVLDPSSELMDKTAQNDAIIQLLPLIMQNPAIIELPIFKQLLENNNIPPFKADIQELIEAQQQQPQTQTPQTSLERAEQEINA